MSDKLNASRRSLLKLASIALAAIPVAAVAAKTEGLRAAMKYKDTPEGGNKCDNCIQFVAPNACKVIPNDNEISPNGWCQVWAKKA